MVRISTPVSRPVERLTGDTGRCWFRAILAEHQPHGVP
jgi:hypothetical protein